MKGDHTLHRDIFDRVVRWCDDSGGGEGRKFDETTRLCKPISPAFAIEIGRWVNPF